jgi:hypothetical protein
MTTDQTTRRQIRTLKVYSLVSTTLLGILGVSAFQRAAQKPRFEEIDVERINLVEKDGRVRLVIANDARSPAAVLSGRTLGKPGGRAGMLFYNDEGDESGGLVFRGRKVNGVVSAGEHLSFDRYGQDQVIVLAYQEDEGKHSQGLTILDRPPQNYFEINARRDTIRQMPEGPAKEAAWNQWALWQGGAAFGAPRLFVGRDTRKASVLDLKDQYGRSRLRLAVDSLGMARIEFLNDSGRVTLRVPDSASMHAPPRK